MLRKLSLKNFTAFSDATLDFGKQLNVIVGENGLGKTHILKAAYTFLAVSARGKRDTRSENPKKSYLQTAIASKLDNVFRPDALGRLARRQAGRSRCEIAWRLEKSSNESCSISFNTSSKTEVSIDKRPRAWSSTSPVYLPTRELLTIYPGFVSLYDTTQTGFDETWRDTCLLLGAPPAKGPRESRIARLLRPLEEDMDGKVFESGGHFYLRTSTGTMEIHLVAEGLRKLAMIARLVATGSLLDQGYLFWDEPEANLNPRIIKHVARTILQLSKVGVQVFIATHSLFLLRELEILQRSEPEVDVRYFGLHSSQEGVRVEQGRSNDDIGDITMLDEQLQQSQRFLDEAESA